VQRYADVVWVRARDLVKGEAVVFGGSEVSGLPPVGPNQGNPILWASITAHEPDAIRAMLPDHAQGPSQCGAYRVKLVADGQEQEVLIDDLIPCYVSKPVMRSDGASIVEMMDPLGTGFVPAFGCTQNRCELWWMLLVKALAKVLGSFEAVLRPVPPVHPDEMTALGGERVMLQGVGATLGAVDLLRLVPGTFAEGVDTTEAARELAVAWRTTDDRVPEDIGYHPRSWKTDELPTFTATPHDPRATCTVVVRAAGPLPADLQVEHRDANDNVIAAKPLKAGEGAEFKLSPKVAKTHDLKIVSSSRFHAGQALSYDFEADTPVDIGLKNAF